MIRKAAPVLLGLVSDSFLLMRIVRSSNSDSLGGPPCFPSTPTINHSWDFWHAMGSTTSPLTLVIRFIYQSTSSLQYYLLLVTWFLHHPLPLVSLSSASQVSRTGVMQGFPPLDCILVMDWLATPILSPLTSEIWTRDTDRAEPPTYVRSESHPHNSWAREGEVA